MLYEEAEKNFEGQKIRRDIQDGDADWEENFYLLKNTKCPAVLTENFFMDNKEDMNYITSIEGREAVIKTHVEAIVKYANKYLK
jgi:N-acetylmuramoyl-L-alanine amidase